MDSLNNLIKNLGPNRVNLNITPNEFEQSPTRPQQADQPANHDVIDSILNVSCKAGRMSKIDLQNLDHSGVKLTKKLKEALAKCWQGECLVDVNDSLVEYLGVALEMNIVVVFIRNSGEFQSINKGVFNNKNETNTCYLTATEALEVLRVQVLEWQSVKADLIENQWLDAPFITKWMTAAEVKSLAKRMGMEAGKGLLKKDLIAKICHTLQKN